MYAHLGLVRFRKVSLFVSIRLVDKNSQQSFFLLFFPLPVLISSRRVRRAHFKLFFSVHHLYIPIIVCLVIHDGFINPIEIIYWMIPAIALFLLERGFTVWRGVPTYESLEETRILKGDVLALSIERPKWFKYSAGHYVWINCPDISLTEWHPFTLTSSPDENYLMVNINCIGDWTKKLKEVYAQHLAAPEKQRKGKERKLEHHIQIELDEILTDSRDSKNIPKTDSTHLGSSGKALVVNAVEAEMMIPVKGKLLPPIRVDGPYGTASGDVLLYTHIVLVGGGIGVTPFISILKSIRHAVLYTNNCPLHGVHFIWVTKNQENFQWFSMMLSDLQRHEDLRGFLRVSIYLTGTRYMINDIRLLGASLLMNKAKQELNEDLVTGLEGQTYFGRPDFGKILLQHNKEWAGNDVGVFFCGPEPLAQAIRVTCRALNRANQAPIGGNKEKKKGAHFFFQQEHF